MIYGTPTVHIDDDQTDRIGIRTVVLSQLWQPSKWPMTQDELDAEKPVVPDVPGGVIFIGEQTRPQMGGLRTQWTFEGINGDGKSVTFKGRNNSIDYKFEPGFSEKSLLILPNIQALFDQFGGYVLDGQIYWPPTIPSGAGGSPNVKSNDGGKPNPMFGRDSKRMMDGTYVFRYAATDYGQAFVGVGTIFATGNLPGFPPPVSNGRNWLKATPGVVRRGPVFDITEMYLLSEEGGHPTAIYGSAGGGSQQLYTTGQATSLGTPGSQVGNALGSSGGL